jgi:drug/metabolite transporter (DMT)-like permease
LILAGSAALAWSTSALFTRLISADLMTMLFWRGIFSGLATAAVFFALERNHAFFKLRQLRWPALAVAVLCALSMISGIGSLRFANAADVMVIYATAPFVAAGLAYLVIGERPGWSTIIASVVALSGVAIMMWGAEFGGSLFGRFLAIVMTFTTAAFTVLMRLYRDVAMMPAMAGAAWICSLFCFWFAAPLSVTAQDLLLIIVFGVVQNALGLVLYTLATRKIPAAEMSLMAALEVPFTPLWVWIFMSEVPSPATLAGGVLVLTALFGHILYEFQRTKAG